MQNINKVKVMNKVLSNNVLNDIIVKSMSKIEKNIEPSICLKVMLLKDKKR